MSEAPTDKVEDPATRAWINEQMREYQAMREKQYNDAMARLESPDIEPASRAAYDATLAEMSALSLSEVVWPDDRPRYDLHHAMEYGEKLITRRADVEERFGGKVPLQQVFDINRYALAALHAFKNWRSNPEPTDGFAKLLSEAAHKRNLLRSFSAMLVSHKLLRTDKLRHFEGGITPESISCDLILLAGVLSEVIPGLSFRLVEPADLMEAELIAHGLLRHAAGGSNPDFWQPTVLYARVHLGRPRHLSRGVGAVRVSQRRARSPPRDGLETGLPVLRMQHRTPTPPPSLGVAATDARARPVRHLDDDDRIAA